MPYAKQKKRAEAFRAMHARPGAVVLVNAWDVASARIVQETGFPAIATTSAGIAFTQGFADGQKIPAERMIAAIAQIAAAVGVPVTADVEAGYGQRPQDASRTARNVIEAGAVGMNFEDATGNSDRPLTELNLQVERIRAIRETAGELGVPLVVNARTDVYLAKVGEPTRRYDETVRRLAAFRDAGADCLFVPGVRDRETIGRIVTDLKYPINILAVPGAPSIPELVRLGVKRISLGSGPMRAALGFLRRLAEEVKTAGTYKLMEGAPSHAEMNHLMAADRRAETPEFGTENQEPGSAD
jgi:2-methylisocitrate lyase-like PEP mutase family enzyme